MTRPRPSRVTALLCGLAVVLGETALAAAPFAPPQGCQLDMTVQNRGCSVSQHYHCAEDAPGDQWVEYFGPAGPTYRSRIDAETRWMESIDLQDELIDRLAPGARDPASLSTLLATGRDDFDFWTVSDHGERLHHIGVDTLTGETTQIGGVTLDVTRFELRTFDAEGNLLIERRGQQFVSRAHRRFYGGVETASDWTGEIHESNDSPMQFSFPGQPGFGATTPFYDCGMLMTQLDDGKVAQ